MRETPHVWFWKDAKGNWSEAVAETDLRNLIDAGAITAQAKIKSPTRTENQELLAAIFPPVAKLISTKAERTAETKCKELEAAAQLQQDLLDLREKTPLVHVVDQAVAALRDEIRLLKKEVSTNVAWSKKISDNLGCLLLIIWINLFAGLVSGVIIFILQK